MIPRRHHSSRRLALLGLVLAALLAAGCGDDEAAGEPRVLTVPGDHATIQGAVDAARPGDLVLVGPGTYREEVVVATEQLVIRGTDRNRVILEGGGELIDGIEVTADRVAVENLTIQGYVINGLIFTGGYDEAQDGPVGYRASHVTAIGNGLYGIYAFGATGGTIEHSYASGHPDSGIYVGQCQPCDAVVVDNVAERNAVGYEATNASGVIVARNVLRANRVGATISSQLTEQLAPQRGSELRANLIVDNDDPATPEGPGGWATGLAISGGGDNRVVGNRITGHDGAGIVLTDLDGFAPTGNELRANELRDNGTDVIVASSDGAVLDLTGTCLADNELATTAPTDLVARLACGQAPGPIPGVALELAVAPSGRAPSEVARPGPQPQMPGAAERRWSAPPASPGPIDLDALVVPPG